MEICSVGGPAPTDLAVNPDGTAINPIALLRHLRGDPSIMSQLQQVEVFSLCPYMSDVQFEVTLTNYEVACSED